MNTSIKGKRELKRGEPREKEERRRKKRKVGEKVTLLGLSPRSQTS